jgi:hypothetical protein
MAAKTFKYLRSLLTNQNSIHDEMKRRLKAENSCYYSVQTFLSSEPTSKNLKIKTKTFELNNNMSLYMNILLPVLLYGYEI